MKGWLQKCICVLCVNTLAYDLPPFLANILSPLRSSSDLTVTNSAHFNFVSIISSEWIHDHNNKVSFDMESLLTNVAIEGAVGAALRWISTVA